MKEFLHHLFIPHESNNYRAKFLHHKTILNIILALFITQLVLHTAMDKYPQVLGIATSFSAQEMLLLTNQKRQEQGVKPLILSSTLSQAAVFKAKDMLAKNYWAHTSPDGTNPWYFFKQVDYDYLYAGENLARGFTTSSDVVTAWMASKTHKENMLSSNYHEVGYAVVEGKLLGEETVLVVELFGSTPETFAGQNKKQTTAVLPQTSIPVQQDIIASIFTNSPIVNTSAASHFVVIALLVGFITILILDTFIIWKRKIIRVVGHNMDHVLFLGVVLLFIVLFWKGVIL